MKKRSTAIAVFVVVVLAFSLIGCRRSLNKACREAENAFFQRGLLADYDVYSAPYDHLLDSVYYANRLLSVVGSDNEPYAEAYEDLRAEQLALLDALDARDIPAIAQENQRFMEAVNAVKALADAGVPLSESHDDYDAILSDLESAQAALDNSAYNDYISAFRDRVLVPFPTNILRRLTAVTPPETFPS